jgi:hypothetical protein
MANDDGNLHVEHIPRDETATASDGVVPGVMSIHRLSDETTQFLEHAADAPLVPWWMWLLGAAASGTVAYGAWRVLRASGSVLVPLALGLPPATARAVQQVAARRPETLPAALLLGQDDLATSGNALPLGLPAPSNAPATLAVLAEIASRVSAPPSRPRVGPTGATNAKSRGTGE